MRCLRSSLYTAPLPSPMSTVVRECDGRDTLDSVAVTIRDKTAAEGALCLTEMFDMPDDVSVVDATTEGMRLMAERAHEELNQAVLYFWTVEQWNMVARGGVLLMDKPAPLARDEIVVVLEQLARHPDYDDIRIISIDQTGTPVVLAHGKIEEV